jgi:hypothetical protein
MHGCARAPSSGAGSAPGKIRWPQHEKLRGPNAKLFGCIGVWIDGGVDGGFEKKRKTAWRRI